MRSTLAIRVRYTPVIAFDDNPNLRWLFCFPHPDDELAIAIWMRRLSQAGAHMTLVWVHSNPVRKAETLNALAILGIEACECHFLEIPDSTFAEQALTIADRIAPILDKGKFDRIGVPSFEQGHPDHDTVNLVVGLLSKTPTVEFPLYHCYPGYQRLNTFPDGEFETLSITASELELKKRALKAFKSQTIWRNVVVFTLLQRLIGRNPRYLTSEVARIQGDLDYSQPNLPAPMAERVKGSRRWKKWIADTAIIRAKSLR